MIGGIYSPQITIRDSMENGSTIKIRVYPPKVSHFSERNSVTSLNISEEDFCVKESSGQGIQTETLAMKVLIISHR